MFVEEKLKIRSVWFVHGYDVAAYHGTVHHRLLRVVVGMHGAAIDP
jgi:hypothetical protein